MDQAGLFQVTFVGAGSRQATSARGPFTIFELQDEQGNKWQAKKNVYDIALQRLHHPLQIDGSVKTNDRGYTNFYLNSINLGETVPAQAYTPQPISGVIQGQTMALGAAQQLPASLTVHQAPGPITSPTEKDVVIWRQAACKVSAVVSKDLNEFWSNVDHLTHFFRTGEKPGQVTHQPQQGTAQGTYPTDDIPF